MPNLNNNDYTTKSSHLEQPKMGELDKTEEEVNVLPSQSLELDTSLQNQLEVKD